MTITRNDDRSRYEMHDGGQLMAIAEFRRQGDVVVFPHTVVDPSRRGQGLGEQLVRYALDDVRRNGDRVLARCWFVARFIEHHSEYQDLLAG